MKELKSKFECVTIEFPLFNSRDKDEECDSYLVVMSKLVELQTLHAQVTSRLETTEKKLFEEDSSATLLGACKNCPLLAKDVEMEDKHIKDLESRLEIAESSKDV